LRNQIEGIWVSRRGYCPKTTAEGVSGRSPGHLAEGWAFKGNMTGVDGLKFHPDSVDFWAQF